MKRRKKQQSDFPKKKKKLGKGKRPPENATQVSFKSQSIYVPGQLEEATGPTTHRKLGLQVCIYVSLCIDRVAIIVLTSIAIS